MGTTSDRTTGNDPVEGLDPGGARSTRPGNPDKSGPPRPASPRTHQTVVSGDRNAGRPEELARDPK